MQFPAIHIKSGRKGRVLDKRISNYDQAGPVVFEYWFEQDYYQDGSASGWFFLRDLVIPGVN